MEKAKSSRERAMEEIVASRTETLDKELQLSATGAHPEVEFEPAPVDEAVQAKLALDESPKQEEPPKEAPPQEEPPAEPIASEPAKPEFVTVKVDHEEIQVPKEEVDKAGGVDIYQMKTAYAKRLKELNELTAAAKQQLRQQQEPPPAPQPNQAEVLKQKADELVFGTDEQRIKAYQELRQPATIPVEAIAENVSRRIEWGNAVKNFAKTNADLLQDRDVQAIALAREAEFTQAIQASGRWPSDFNKFYEDLGTNLRMKFGKPAAVDTKTRQEKKEAIAEPKTASGRVPSPPETKPKSVAEIVEEQRRARHQASMR